MLVELKETATKGSISNSVGNLKTHEIEIEKNLDTLVLSIDMGEYFRVGDIVKTLFYDKFIKFKPNSSYYYIENYSLSTENAKINISSAYRGLSSYYLSIYISSLKKLQDDLNINISKKRDEFSKDIKDKIVDQLITVDVDQEYMYVKQCDLSLDLKFPKFQGNFNTFCRDLTSTIMNMKLSYLKGDKKRIYNTGYYLSKSKSERMRFYNKSLKETNPDDQLNEVFWEYKNTYRIEYICDTKYQIDKYLRSKKFTEIDIEQGFDKIIDICGDSLKKYRELIEQYTTGNASREGSSMMEKYSYRPAGNQLICDEVWEVEADMNRIFSGQKPVFSEYSNSYHKKKNVWIYSYVSYLLENELIEYFRLFDRIINKAKKTILRHSLLDSYH